MAETTYYRNKVYIPRAVRESLGLVDGDKLYIKVLDKSATNFDTQKRSWQEGFRKDQ